MMPTVLPRVRRHAPLTVRQTARVLWLAACIRRLGKAMERASRQSRRPGDNQAGDRLLRLAQRWLARNEEMAALLGVPDPIEVRQVRAIFGARPAGASETETPGGCASRPDRGRAAI